MFIPRLAKFYKLNFVYLLRIHNEFRIERVKLFGFLKVLSSSFIVFQSFQGKGTSKIRMAVFRLQLYHLVIVFERFLELVSQQIAFRSLVNIAGLVVSELNRFGEWGYRFIEVLKVRLADTPVVVDVCFVGFERFIF